MEKLKIYLDTSVVSHKLIISPDFTIEDIHKIREYNYNITKDMTPQERRDYYNKRGMEVHKQIQEMQLQEV